MELISNKANKVIKVSRYVANKYRQLLLTLTSCDLCGQACTQHLLLCQHCEIDLPTFKQTVVQGDLLNWPAINRALPQITFDHLICLAPYTSPFSDWLTQLKYSGRFEVAKLLAELMAEHLSESLSAVTLNNPIDSIACVPLHISKWQQRGYNQAHLIAKHFAQLIDKPYLSQIINRVKKTTSQVGQSGGARRKNLKGAFTINFFG